MNKTIQTFILPLLLIASACEVTAKDSIVYDAEYVKTYNQHKAEWDKEDTDLQKSLADLQAKTGKKPNIIYFMWDDAAYGRVGHPMLSKLTGIDQTAMFLNGDTKGRCDYVHIYTGPLLAATVKQQFKRHWVGDRPGLAGKGFFDLYRDPKEIQPMMAQFLWAWEPFDSMKARHQELMKEYPNTPITRGKPFEGIELLPQEREVVTPYASK